MLVELNTSDWEEAFKYAGELYVNAYGCLSTSFTREDVIEIYGMDNGENDERPWRIYGRLNDNRYFYLEAGCDYTGWNCQADGSAWVSSTRNGIIREGLTEEARRIFGLVEDDVGTIKIKEPNILEYLIGAHNIQYSEHTERNKVFFVFKKSEDRLPKKTILLDLHKKHFLKFRTPTILRPYIGNTIKVYKDYFSKVDGEIFRIEPVDFMITRQDKFIEKFINPTITKSGIFLIPRIYANQVLDERLCDLKVSFYQTNQKMIKDGAIAACIIDRDMPISFPLYEYSLGLRSRVMDTLINIASEAGKNICNFTYEATVPLDGFHRYGTIVFREI